jgi:hypothetical protein
MKQVVLSEGKNDVHFISSFFKERGGNFQIKQFLGEHADGQIRHEETTEIKNFRERRNPYHVLAKSENGKSNLEQVFAALVNQLMRIDPEIVVLVDLDGGSLRGFVNDLDEQVRTQHSGRGTELGDPSITERTGDMVAAVCEVLKGNGSRKGEFRIVAFKQTLERVADVSKDEELDARQDKIEAFLEEGHVYDLLDAVLPDREEVR